MLNEYLIKARNLGVELEELKQLLKLPEIERRADELKEKIYNSPEAYGDIAALQEYNELTNKMFNLFELSTALIDLVEVIKFAIDEEVDDSEFIVQDYERISKQIQELRLESLFSGEYDKNNVILSIHAGTGGKEAQDWASMLMRMYSRWAEQQGYSCRILDYQPGEEMKICKHAVLEIKGKNAYGMLKNENGVHRMIRVSPFDAQNRRHTSFAAIEVMPEIESNNEINIDPKDLRIDTYRSSGAGGQHVNKTESAIRITHIPTNIVVSCQTERSQHQNRDYAMKMLMSKLMQIKEQEHLDNIADIKGEQKPIQWGNQIRSYVFMPYQQVKDHRTNFETGNISAVMDGNINDFIYKSLAN